MSDINEPTMPAIPEAAIEAMLAEEVRWDEGVDSRGPIYSVHRRRNDGEYETVSEHGDRSSMEADLRRLRAHAALVAALPHLSIPSASSPIQGAVTDKEIEAVRAQLATVTRALTLLARAARSVFGALAPGESLAGDAGHTNHLIHLTNEVDALVLSLAAAIPRPRSEAATREDAEAVAPIPSVPVVAWGGHLPNAGSADSVTIATAGERMADEWSVGGMTVMPLVRQSDHLAAVEKLTRERDEAREDRNFWEDRENKALLRADAAEAEVSRLKAAFRDISSFSPEPASHIGPFEQIARHARATTLAALSNQAGASK